MISNRFTIALLVAALAGGGHHIRAQEAALEYTSEWHTDFNSSFNWINLLRLSGSLPLSQKFSIEGATISVARTGADPIIDDLQGFSNIEADNLPLAVAVLGAEFNFGNSTVFGGIRNVGEDYFTTPATSLFVNSSCGIFPTLSANYEIANYPLSGLCLHYRYDSPQWVLQTSLYEGRGHRNIAGHDNIFTLSPSTNGVFSITSAEFINHGSNYNLGCALYYGVRSSDDNGIAQVTQQAQSAKPQYSRPPKSLSIAPWANAEQRLTDRCTLLLQASAATSATVCSAYAGVGATYSFPRLTAGVFTDYAHYCDADEFVTELTCRIPISPNVYLQPTLEAIFTDHCFHTIGILRVSVNL